MWKYFLAAAVVFLYYPHLNQALSCEALMQSAEPEANGTIHIQFVAELEATEYNDLISCLATIGQAPLPKDKATNVWRSLKRVSFLIPIRASAVLKSILISVLFPDRRHSCRMLQVYGLCFGGNSGR